MTHLQRAYGKCKQHVIIYDRLTMKAAEMLLFMLLLLQVAAEGDMNLGPPCPLTWSSAPCVCTGHSISPHIDCSRASQPSQLNTVFDSLPESKSFVTFKLYKSDLTSLPDNPFHKTNFSIFDITETNVTKIPQDFFKGSAERVISITVSKTKVMEFPFKALNNFTKLETLVVSESRLTSIPSQVFGDIGLPKLQELDLRSNEIKTLDSEAFVNLPYLSRLDLSRNNLTVLGAKALFIKDFKEIILVYLNDNQIKKIDKDAFMNLTFSGLHLENNKMEMFESEVFLPLIEYSEKADAVIYVEGNPFQCDASLRWLVELPMERKQYIRGFYCQDGRPLESLTVQDLNKPITTSTMRSSPS